MIFAEIFFTLEVKFLQCLWRFFIIQRKFCREIFQKNAKPSEVIFLITQVFLECGVIPFLNNLFFNWFLIFFFFRHAIGGYF